MLIIFLTISLSHKHPHELLDSVVKERLVDSFVSTEARILRFPQSLSSVYFEVFQNFPNNFKHLARFDLSLREANSTAFQTAVNHLFSPLPIYNMLSVIRAASSLLTSVNSLFPKKFSVSSAPEVGRIIDRSTGASSAYLTVL